MAKLFRIIHESIVIYCGSRGNVSVRSLMDVYERFSAWKENLPTDMSKTDAEPLPHILHLQSVFWLTIISKLN